MDSRLILLGTETCVIFK